MISCKWARLSTPWMAAGLTLMALAAAPAAAADAPVAPLPVAAYVAPADFAQVTLSADGRYLAALSPLKGKRNLVVLDLQTMKSRAVTAMSNFDVVNYRWVGSEFLVYSLGTLETPTGADYGYGGGLFAVKADGSGFRKLQPTVEEQIGNGQMSTRSMQFVGPVPGSGVEILVAGNLRTQRLDYFRVNLVTGERKLLTTDRPGFVDGWVLDNDGAPRVAIVRDKEDAPEQETTRTILLRDSLDSPWREIAKFKFEQVGRWSPRAFMPDNKHLIVSATGNRRTSALYRFDVDSMKLGELLVGHPRYDVSEAALERSPETGQVTSLSFFDDRFQVVHFDEDTARVQSQMEAQFKGMAVDVDRKQGGKTLVTVWSDRQPHSYYLYDENAKTLKLLLKSRRGMDERHLVEMRPFLLKTRDGLEIPSFYFLPNDYKPGQRLPTVVHVHGGPHSRADHWGPMDTWGAREAQLLASRGYAVVLPNFRITPGLGGQIYRAGWGQIGRKMSEDHEDAARWAVEQGFADAGRICISGASYGGYATLWASIKSADVFKCGVAGLVVSDMERQLTSTQTDFSGSRSAVAFWKRMLGVTGDDWGPAHEVSPARHAARSNLPLFIWAGAADRRTPLEQTELMVDALKKAGKPPEQLMIKADESHGYGKPENNIELFEAMLKFFDRHIGAGSRSGSVTASPPVTQQPPAQQ